MRSVRVLTVEMQAPIARAAALLAKAERPLLIGGGGVIDSDAAGDAVKLAEHLDMALIPSYGHSDALPNSHPLFIGMPGWRGAPEAHTVNVREVRLAAGAEFVVMVCGDIMTMPGLPKVPSAAKIDLVDGKVVGLF